MPTILPPLSAYNHLYTRKSLHNHYSNRLCLCDINTKTKTLNIWMKWHFMGTHRLQARIQYMISKNKLYRLGCNYNHIWSKTFKAKQSGGFAGYSRIQSYEFIKAVFREWVEWRNKLRSTKYNVLFSSQNIWKRNSDSAHVPTKILTQKNISATPYNQEVYIRPWFT